MRRVTALCLLPLLGLLVSCDQPRSASAPHRPNPCEAKVAELLKENTRLRSELLATQESSATLTGTLSSVEQDLVALAGTDTNIRNTQRSIETRINIKSSRAQVHDLIQRLKELLNERRALLTKAQSDLAAFKTKVSTEDAGKRDIYLKQVGQLEDQIKQKETESERLAQDRDSYERLYRGAKKEAAEEHDARETAEQKLAEERRQLEIAEQLRYRVFILTGTKATLRAKGVLTGRWYQRKSTECLCAECRTEEDRRTLKEVPLPAPASSVTVYSSHPKQSFRIIEKGAEKAALVIQDSDRFWSMSHCLVVGY